jgi:hypothetical protein
MRERETQAATYGAYDLQGRLSPVGVEGLSSWEMPLQESRRPSENASTPAWINYFDTNWKKEGLPFNWYNLSHKDKAIGFSMQSQMNLLKSPNNAEQVADWRQKTKQDLLGFKLEYLSDHLVYPQKYHRNPTDPTRLEDPLYGKSKYNPNASADIEEMVSADERNGSVKESLRDLKKFFLSDKTPDGSLGIMISPKGETGLKTDNGQEIEYPDSYFFIMQKTGDTVTNYTVKTDLSVEECREASFTGKPLSEFASVEDQVRATAMITPGEHDSIKSVKDVIGVLKNIKPDYAFKKIGWEEVEQDIVNADKLYNFDSKTSQAIADFEAFTVTGHPTRLVYQKAIAATILRMSDVFFQEQEHIRRPIILKEGSWQYPQYESYRSFGAMLAQVAERPGCAGGGGKNSVFVTSLATRLGTVGEDQYGGRTFNCPSCGKTNLRPEGGFLPACQHCNSTEVAC